MVIIGHKKPEPLTKAIPNKGLSGKLIVNASIEN